MERIIVCLKKIDNEYKIKTSELKNIISSDPREKLDIVEENYFLIHFNELKTHMKQINDIDEEFYKKLNLLHDAWIEDYDKVYNLCVNTKKKDLLLKKKISVYDNDKLHAYCDDLKSTTKSIENVIKRMNIKISSLQIQEFLK